MISALESICKAEGIHLDPAPWLKSTRGLVMSDGVDKAIIYGTSLTGWEQVSVIAHEIGHHVLGHLSEHAHR